MRLLLLVLAATLLCSCSSAPVVQTSFNRRPMSMGAGDPRSAGMQHWRAYADESDDLAWLHATPNTPR